MSLVVKSAKFIYGENTRKLSHEILFQKVGFLRHSNFFEVAAATWMQKIMYNREPKIITDHVRHPTYHEAYKITPKIKPKSTRFKRTAIACGIANYNKLSKTTASLRLKFKS